MKKLSTDWFINPQNEIDRKLIPLYSKINEIIEELNKLKDQTS